MRRSIPLVLVVALVLAPGPGARPAPTLAAPETAWTLVAVHPHDDTAFTQGLEFRAGEALFETTGIEGASTLRRVDLETGEVLRTKALADKFFGEGMTIFKRRLFWLTWTSGKAFVYRPSTFKRIATFTYEGEGWGLTNNGHRLIMSNGSDVIAFRSPRTFEVKRTISVTDGDAAIHDLNELEWVGGEIFANVWQTDLVARIDPETGDVIAWIDLSELKAAEDAAGDPDVTNGIAYIASADRLFVTGKNWAHVYEIDLQG